VVKVYAAAAVIAVLAAAAFGFVAYGRALERADHNEKVAELQSKLADLGLVIQKQESEAADATRQITEKERERINAIRANDHTSKEVARLQRGLDKARKEIEATGNKENNSAINYRVVSIDAISRVHSEARSCVGLSESKSASILQERLSEITGDGISRTISFIDGEYCACAVKYNALWRAADRLLSECTKTPEL